MTKHVHYDMIEEWARTGKDLQCRRTGVDNDWVCTEFPVWSADFEYRFKPEAIEYKRYIISLNGKKEVRVTNRYQSKDTIFLSCYLVDPTKSEIFVRWIDEEWQEVEI